MIQVDGEPKAFDWMEGFVLDLDRGYGSRTKAYRPGRGYFSDTFTSRVYAVGRGAHSFDYLMNLMGYMLGETEAVEQLGIPAEDGAKPLALYAYGKIDGAMQFQQIL